MRIFNNRHLVFSVQIRSIQGLIYRHCIIPENYELDRIRTYIAYSMRRDQDSIGSISKEGEVFLIDSMIDQNEGIGNGFIDSYWIDVVEYIVEVYHQRNCQTFSVIADMNTNEQTVKDEIRKIFFGKKIIIDVFRDAWLIRQKKYVELKKALLSK